MGDVGRSDALDKGQPELIHQLGSEGVTVLHKGVRHGCVKLVKFILVDMFDAKGNCTCSLHIGADRPCLTREGLLRKTCSYGNTAVNMAVVSGSPKMVLLLKWAIDMSLYKDPELTEDMSSDDEDSFKDIRKIHSSFMREKGCEEEEGTESASSSKCNMEVPGVEDDAIDKIYEIDRKSESIMIHTVYSIIEDILCNPGTDLQEEMDMLKDRCQKDVDFEFVPLAHGFLHFLLGLRCTWDDLFNKLRMKVLERIILACNACDNEEGAGGAILKAAFNILDTVGRTLLHVAFGNYMLHDILDLLDEMEMTMNIAPTLMAECLNAKDGAGRTCLHLMCIHDEYIRDRILNKMDLNATLSPLCLGELEALKKCFPLYDGVQENDCRPIHLAVIFDLTYVFKKVFLANGSNMFHINVICWLSYKLA